MQIEYNIWIDRFKYAFTDREKLRYMWFSSTKFISNDIGDTPLCWDHFWTAVHDYRSLFKKRQSRASSASKTPPNLQETPMRIPQAELAGLIAWIQLSEIMTANVTLLLFFPYIWYWLYFRWRKRFHVIQLYLQIVSCRLCREINYVMFAGSGKPQRIHWQQCVEVCRCSFWFNNGGSPSCFEGFLVSFPSVFSKWPSWITQNMGCIIRFFTHQQL